MLSRVAESIYWIARYIERAENVARFIDVTLNVILDQPEGAAEPWQPLVSTTGDHKLFVERYGNPTGENVIKFLTFDPEYPNSIISCLHYARENARSVRETISSEMWEQLNVFYYLVMDAAIRGETLDAPQDFFHEVKQASHLFHGITDGTLSRNQAWHFYRLGQMLERADKTSRILDVKYFILLPSAKLVGTPTDDLQWQAVLRSVSGFEMYRKRHHRITPARVVEFLVLDREFPRAVQYCVEMADQSLHAISGRPPGSFSNAAEQRLGQLKSELAYANVEEIIHAGLHQYLDNLQTRLNKISEATSETFFALEQAAEKK
jgi:uncharacterized alpha-E superfamily protein